MLAVVALVTVFFVWAFGHPVAWSVIGCLFAPLPLAGLVLACRCGRPSGGGGGPGWVGVRLFGRWRVVDLGSGARPFVWPEGVLMHRPASEASARSGVSAALGVSAGPVALAGRAPVGRFGGGGAPGTSVVFEDAWRKTCRHLGSTRSTAGARPRWCDRRALRPTP